MKIEEINAEIKRLEVLKRSMELSQYKTADGMPIQYGVPYYYESGSLIASYTLTEETVFPYNGYFKDEHGFDLHFEWVYSSKKALKEAQILDYELAIKTNKDSLEFYYEELKRWKEVEV